MNIYEDALINEAVDEELGISDEVSNLAMKLAMAVEKNINKLPKQKISNGFFTNTFRFNISTFNRPIAIKVKNFFFGDKKIYADIRLKQPKGVNIFKKEDTTLEMFFDYINNKPYSEDFYGAFYHELMHIFQDVKSGGGYKNRPNYSLAASNAFSKSKGVRTISEIIYYATDKEIYAFAGQAYQGIMNMDLFNSPYSNVREAIVDTKLYNGYTKLKNGIVFLEKYKDNTNLHTLLKQFEVTYHQIYEHCEWAIKEYAKYIGRVIVKAEKDIEERNLKNGASITPPDSVQETISKFEKIYV